MQPLIETHGLTRIYTLGRIEVTALKDIDLQVDRGEFVGVTGPSGSGKSTLMALLERYWFLYDGQCDSGGIPCITCCTRGPYCGAST